MIIDYEFSELDFSPVHCRPEPGQYVRLQAGAVPGAGWLIGTPRTDGVWDYEGAASEQADYGTGGGAVS